MSRLIVLHEFGGGYDVTMADSVETALRLLMFLTIPGLNMVLALTLKTGSNSHIYIDVERSSGSDFKKDWQWNAGARWTF